MNSKAIFAALLSLAAALQSSAQAAPGDSIGSAVRVVNRVTAETDQGAHPLAQGDGVLQNETIEVAAASLGELRLNDDTKLALGPGARLKLDKFVYDPDKAAGTIAVDLAKGAFRFVTGRAKKPSYIIRSPTASIAVRGTIFDVYVEPSGAMWVLLHEGSIEVCNAAKQCRAVKDPCGIVRVGAGGVLSNADTWNRHLDVREIDFETAFPFVENPPQFDPAPRFTRVSIESGSCAGQDSQPPGTQRAEILEPLDVVPRQSSARPESSSAVPAVASEPVGGRSWTGVYAGVNLGGGWGTGDTKVGCDDPTGSFDTVFGTPNCEFPISSGALETRYSTDPRGFIGGGQVGYNFQIGNIVWGLEADISRASIDGKDTESRNVPPTSPGTRTVTQDMDWFGTIRGRLGFVAGNWLLYSTGGLAVGRVDYSYESSFPLGNAFARVAESKTAAGWTAGAGAEVAFGQWSLKGEYLFYNLGQEDLRTQFFIAGGVPTPAYFEPEFETQGHIARVGLNFHFN